MIIGAKKKVLGAKEEKKYMNRKILRLTTIKLLNTWNISKDKKERKASV